MFKKRTPSQQLLRNTAHKCVVRKSGSSTTFANSCLHRQRGGSLSPSLNDLEHRYPDCDAGFSAAFDSQLMSGRMDVVTNAQDLVGALAEQRYERSFLPPIGPPYGIAIGSLQAVTRFLLSI